MDIRAVLYSPKLSSLLAWQLLQIEALLRLLVYSITAKEQIWIYRTLFFREVSFLIMGTVVEELSWQTGKVPYPIGIVKQNLTPYFQIATNLIPQY